MTSNVILSLINFLARDIWKMLEIPLKTFRFLCFKRSHYRIALSWFCPDLMERLSTTAPTKLKNLAKCIRAFSPHGHLLTVSMLSSDLFSRPVLLETQLLQKPFRLVSQFGVKQTYPPSAVSSFYSLVKRNYVAQSQRCHCEQAWLSTAQSLFIFFFRFFFFLWWILFIEFWLYLLQFHLSVRPSWQKIPVFGQKQLHGRPDHPSPYRQLS